MKAYGGGGGGCPMQLHDPCVFLRVTQQVQAGTKAYSAAIYNLIQIGAS
jgi:hypothetical protein